MKKIIIITSIFILHIFLTIYQVSALDFNNNEIPIYGVVNISQNMDINKLSLINQRFIKAFNNKTGISITDDIEKFGFFSNSVTDSTIIFIKGKFKNYEIKNVLDNLSYNYSFIWSKDYLTYNFLIGGIVGGTIKIYDKYVIIIPDTLFSKSISDKMAFTLTKQFSKSLKIKSIAKLYIRVKEYNFMIENFLEKIINDLFFINFRKSFFSNEEFNFFLNLISSIDISLTRENNLKLTLSGEKNSGKCLKYTVEALIGLIKLTVVKIDTKATKKMNEANLSQLFSSEILASQTFISILYSILDNLKIENDNKNCTLYINLNKNKSLINLSTLTSILLTSGIKTTLSLRETRKKEFEDRKNRCIANMKNIESALALYLMENPTINRIDSKSILKKLVFGGFLKTIPICPSGGTYKVKFINERVNVKCSLHGPISDDSIF